MDTLDDVDADDDVDAELDVDALEKNFVFVIVSY